MMESTAEGIENFGRNLRRWDIAPQNTSDVARRTAERQVTDIDTVKCGEHCHGLLIIVVPNRWNPRTLSI